MFSLTCPPQSRLNLELALSLQKKSHIFMPQVEPEKVSLHNNINQNLIKLFYKSLLSAFAWGLGLGLSRIHAISFKRHPSEYQTIKFCKLSGGQKMAGIIAQLTAAARKRKDRKNITSAKCLYTLEVISVWLSSV